MSWFSRFFPSSPPPPAADATRQPAPERRRRPSGQPGLGSDAALNPAHVRRRSDRAVRRELLHSVVREALVGLDILSMYYKFKVLSVDAEGTQFLILIDLSTDVRQDTHAMHEMESAIIARALNQRQLHVNAVYWRAADPTALVRQRPEPTEAPAEHRSAHRRQPAATTPSGFPITELPDYHHPLRPLGDSQYGDVH